MIQSMDDAIIILNGDDTEWYVAAIHYLGQQNSAQAAFVLMDAMRQGLHLRPMSQTRLQTVVLTLTQAFVQLGDLSVPFLASRLEEQGYPEWELKTLNGIGTPYAHQTMLDAYWTHSQYHQNLILRELQSAGVLYDKRRPLLLDALQKRGQDAQFIVIEAAQQMIVARDIDVLPYIEKAVLDRCLNLYRAYDLWSRLLSLEEVVALLAQLYFRDGPPIFKRYVILLLGRHEDEFTIATLRKILDDNTVFVDGVKASDMALTTLQRMYTRSALNAVAEWELKRGEHR